jgi:hypothetical protein
MPWKDGKTRRSHGLHSQEAGNGKKKDNVSLGIFSDRMISIAFAVTPYKFA